MTTRLPAHAKEASAPPTSPSRTTPLLRPRALIVVLATLAVDFSFNFNRWLVYGVMVAVLLLLILVDFVQDYLRMMTARAPLTLRSS